MAYYVIDQTSGDILYLSDFEPPNSYVAEGHHICDSPIPVSEITNRYTWDKSSQTYVMKSSKLTKREFIKRFTVVEYATIKQAATQNTMLDYYWQLFMLAEYIDMADTDTVSGITMLEQAGLINTGRAGEILNG